MTPIGNAGRKEANFSEAGALPDEGCRCLANQRTRARICTPPRMAATTNHGATKQKPESPVFIPRLGRRQQPAQTRNKTQINERMSMSTQEHKPPTRSGKGQRKPRFFTKAAEPTRSREWQQPTDSRKKCLANPLRARALTKQKMQWKKHQKLDQLPVAATTDRTRQTSDTVITHQDAKNQGSNDTEQHT